MKTVYTTFIKSAIDWLVAIILLLILLPIFLLIIVLLLLTGHRRLFFVQPRIGFNEKVFKLVKFCTMTDACGADGALLSDQLRLTKFGTLLRKTSLDELPQLWNVLKMDMSFIGPRPLLVEYLPRYSVAQRRRHLAKPGISGWAQVNGRNAISWQTKFERDVYYVDHLSFGLDIKICLLTIKKVFFAEGISQQGQATAEIFTGNTDSNDDK